MPFGLQHRCQEKEMKDWQRFSEIVDVSLVMGRMGFGFLEKVRNRRGISRGSEWINQNSDWALRLSVKAQRDNRIIHTIQQASSPTMMCHTPMLNVSPSTINISDSIFCELGNGMWFIIVAATFCHFTYFSQYCQQRCLHDAGTDVEGDWGWHNLSLAFCNWYVDSVGLNAHFY